MMIDALVAESRRARAIAEDYRRRGFTVLENPLPDQLPEFLAFCQPNLVAQKSGKSPESEAESVVVVVKARHRVANDPQIAELAELLRDKPDWKLELALVEADSLLEVPEAAVAFGLKEIWGYHYEAGKLLDAGFMEAAVLTAWAAAEATVRFLLADDEHLLDEVESPERFSTHRLLTSAVYLGVIARADYYFLAEAKKQRDAYAHGFALPAVDAAVVAREILSVTVEMLEQERSVHSN